MTEKEMINFLNKDIRITCTDKKVYEGHCSSFEWAIDNEPEIACLAISRPYGGETDFLQTEIESIEVIEKKKK